MEKEATTQETPAAAPSLDAATKDSPSASEGGNQWGAQDNDLTRKLEEWRSKADSHWQDLLRARAEVENVRRRGERNVENAHKYALERFASELLPVKDSLELGMAVDSDVARLREGMALTLKILTAAMEKFGIREVNPVNERFNPELHQAMSVQPSATLPPNTVSAVYQKGYTLNERLMRPAMVIVSQAAPPSESGGPGEILGDLVV